MNRPLDVTEVTAWVSYLDVYGFKSIVQKAEIDTSQAKLYSDLSAVHSQLASRIHKDTHVYILSDNYFLVHPTSRDISTAHDNCLADIRCAIDLHKKAGLPLRGGIAYGTVGIGPNVLVGSPVARAVAYERLSRVPLVMLPEREAALARLELDPQKFINHTVTDESNALGIISTTFVVPVNPRTYIEYCEEQYNFFRVRGPEKVAKDWLDVVQLLSTICGRSENEKSQ